MTTVEKLENNVAEINSAFQNIKSKIAEKGVEVGDELKPVNYAQKVGQVYDAGRKDEYDAFWDDFQNKGKAKKYSYAFAGEGVWTSKTFRPKYDLIVLDAQYMFAYGALAGLDLTQHLESLGVTLDTSQSTSFSRMFYYSAPSRVPILDTTSADTLTSLCHNANVRIFDKIILRNDGSQTVQNMLQGSSSIVSLTLEGVIGQNGFSVQWCTKLSRASIESIINALSTTTTGLTVTLSKTAVNKAFETSEGANDGESSPEWEILGGENREKKNWTISLV